MLRGEVGENIELKTLLELPSKSTGLLVKHMFPMVCVGTSLPVMERSGRVLWGEGWQLALSSEVAIQKREGKFYLCLEDLK